MSDVTYETEEVKGKVRDLIVERIGLHPDTSSGIEFGTETTHTTCGEGTCQDWWDRFVILVDGEVVYESGQPDSPFAELQRWLEDE